MNLKSTLFFACSLFLIQNQSIGLDIFEKEALKQKNQKTDTKKSDHKPPKKPIAPMPNNVFMNQESADFYSLNVNPTNESDLLEFLRLNENTSKQIFTSPDNKKYIPPTTDGLRKFKHYKTDKQFRPSEGNPALSKQRINCSEFKELNEREKCIRNSDPFVEKRL